MSEALRCDVAIVGGGIAGLWLFQRLHRRGYHPVLIDARDLGTGQTLAAQGILHGGAKYSMHGQVSDHTQALAAMPGIWKEALSGQGEVDLRQAAVLAEWQILWSQGGIAQNISAFFASKLVRSGVAPVERPSWPDALRHPDFKGRVYALEELIVDTRTVLKALIGDLGASVCRAASIKVQMDGSALAGLKIQGSSGDLFLSPSATFFTAGSGNGEYAETLGLGSHAMQRRPLKMIYLRGAPSRFFGHCITTSPKPRITITTHQHGDDLIWYLGGEVAERGAQLSDQAAIEFARSELADLFPWIDISQAQWGLFTVDRAEPRQDKSVLPPGPTLLKGPNYAVGWPTKMVFAPSFAAKALEWLDEKGIGPREAVHLPLERARLGVFPWEDQRGA